MIDISKFKDLYISETEDQLQILNKNLLVLEKSIKGKDGKTDKKTVLNDLMRASHTIKGSSATMGFNDMAYLAHVMEDVFDNGRNDLLELNEEMVDYAFRSADKLEESLNSVKDSNKELKLKKLADKIKNLTGVDTTGIGKSARNQDASVKPENETAPEVEKSSDDLEKEETLNKDLEKTETDTKKDINHPSESTVKINHIKVPVKRLDTLMDLIEELVIEKMALRRLSVDNKDLKEVVDRTNLLIQSLEYEVMQARLVPVDQIFARFPRMIRDLSKAQGKNVDFRLDGGELELDRTIVDKLGEPLVHLLRNAIDHGISKEGYVKLMAKRDRENAVIIVENDDKSIDLEEVKVSAVKRGIVSDKELESFTDEQVIDLIFHPKLSTNKEVTEISGRGIGLNVVKKFAESSGGKVIVENINPGVRFTLNLPLTLAIINSLLVEVGNNIYAIPFANIDRSIIVEPKNVKKMADKNVAIVDEDKVPLIDLRNVFGSEEEVEKSDAKEVEGEKNANDLVNNNLITVVIKSGKERVGLVVDKLASEQEVTVKPLSSVLKSIKGFSGSTILGDGRTILILDAGSLLETIK